MVSTFVFARSKSAVFAFIAALILAATFTFAAPAFATVQPDACDAVTQYQKSSDYSDTRVDINYSDSDQKISVSAKSGYVITEVALQVSDDGFSGFHVYATGPVNNFNPPGNNDVDDAKVTVKKVCKTSIIVKKVIVGGAEGDTADDFSFKYDKQGNTPAVTKVFEADGQNDLKDLALGAYDVTEVAAPGWTTSYSSDRPGANANNCNNIDVDNGNDPATCTITNTKIVPTANVIATKIVCDNEASLPNWGLGGPDMGATTATDFVASHADCHFAEGWSFEWGNQNAGDTPDDFVGPAGNGYTTFGTTDANGVTSVAIPVANVTELHLREVLQANYIPFTHGAHSDNSDNVSAEFYCADDTLNYDNWDFIRGPQAGTTYYCVAFNALKPARVIVHKTVVGSESSPINFSYSFNGSAPVSFDMQGNSTSTATSTGAYTVVETLSPSYNASYSAGCTGTIAAGETKYCTITNTYIPPVPPSCDTIVSTDTVVSNTTTTVDGNPSVAVSSIPGPWTTSLSGSGAIWIWGEDPISTEDQTAGSTETFTKTFSIAGTPTGASLEIAADNTYTVSVNGHTPIVSDANLDQFTSTDIYPIPAGDLVSGVNTITFTVTNAPYSGANPAGLVYKLTVNRNACIPAPTTSTVTMCKVDQNQHPLQGWTLTLKGANVEDVNVPANLIAGVNTVANLTSGASYIATAVGTWLNDREPDNLVDAEYSTEDGWATQMDGFTGYSNNILELQLNGAFGNWGTYNAAHTYARSFLGTGAQGVLGIFDGVDPTADPAWYGDNSGSLNVNISNGYAGITGENGCVTFQSVPVGTYTAGEIMQDGWHNVSGLGSVVVDNATETFNIVNSNALACNAEATKSIISSATTGNAVVLTFNHAAWVDETTIDPLAKWVWKVDGVTDPTVDETQTFTDTFTILGTPLADAALTLAADNQYAVSVNGNPVAGCSSTGEFNYGATTNCVVPMAMLVNGANTISFTITNMALAGSSAETNPAGVVYKLTYTENECVVPPPVDMCSNLQGNQDTIPEGYEAGPENTCVEVPPPVQCVADQELIANGSFESPVVTDHGNTWQLYANATPGLVWNVGYVSGNANPLLEIQRGYSGWTAAQGAQWAELDSNEPSMIYQDITTVPGKTYTFSFDYAARPDASSASDNMMNVMWGGTVVGATSSNLVSAGPNNAWIHNVYTVVATSTMTRVGFSDTGTNNSLGNFVDNVSLMCVPVAPSTDLDLSVVKTVNDSTPDVGQTITYTIVVTNNSATVAATGVKVTDLLPTGVTYVSHSATQGTYTSGTGMWSVGAVMVGDSQTLTITATVSAATEGTIITNTATASSDNTDTNPGNNTGNVSVTVNQGSGGGPTTGTLEIVKHTTDGNGTFTFNVKDDEDFSQNYSTTTANHWATSTVELTPGWYDVTETVPSDWDLDGVVCVYEEGTAGNSIQNGKSVSIVAGETVTCTFTNSPTEDGDGPIDVCPNIEGNQSEVPSGKHKTEGNQCVDNETPHFDSTPNGGGGGGGGGNGPIWGGTGQVLGASVSLPELPTGCDALIHTYMRKGKKNDAAEVKLLQQFLNDHMGFHLPITGVFGSMTDKAVKDFQTKYADQVLTPWGLNVPTGFVYRTTQRWVNLMHCKDLNIPMPTNLIPYHNEDQ